MGLACHCGLSSPHAGYDESMQPPEKKERRRGGGSEKGRRRRGGEEEERRRVGEGEEERRRRGCYDVLADSNNVLINMHVGTVKILHHCGVSLNK